HGPGVADGGPGQEAAQVSRPADLGVPRTRAPRTGQDGGMSDGERALRSTMRQRDGAPRARRPMIAWDPGRDTLIALVTLLGFWACYWAGTALDGACLLLGVRVFGAGGPAVVVLRRRREGMAG